MEMWTWMVTDLTASDPEPQFGPFPTKEAAEEFAELMPSYWAHEWPPVRP